MLGESSLFLLFAQSWSSSGSAWVSTLWVPRSGLAPFCGSLQDELGEMVHVQASSGLFIGNTSILSPCLINFLIEVVYPLGCFWGKGPQEHSRKHWSAVPSMESGMGTCLINDY